MNDIVVLGVIAYDFIALAFFIADSLFGLMNIILFLLGNLLWFLLGLFLVGAYRCQR